MSQWTVNDIPDLQGYISIVTGANSGLGLETVRALSRKGSHVVMACRDMNKGQQVLNAIAADVPGASFELVQLDLASLDSVRNFFTTFQQSHDRLDLLFNNAGVMAIPRRETKDGFEMQFGTNHLGHFALTGLLLPLLLATPQSRIITTSSIARRMGKVNLADPHHRNSYSRWKTYAHSKRSNLLFSFELQRRLVAAGAQTISVAAHPGYANTNLQGTSAELSNAHVERTFYALFNSIIGQSSAMGASPQLYAGTSPAIHGGELVGPANFGGMRGYPRIETSAQKEDDRSVAARLWELSEELTDVNYTILNAGGRSIEA